MSDFNAARINSAIRTLNALTAPVWPQMAPEGELSPAEHDHAARRMPVQPIKSAGLSIEHNLIIELCQHIDALVSFLHTDKIAYRKDAVEICRAIAAAGDCHNRALGLGAHRGKGIVK